VAWDFFVVSLQIEKWNLTKEDIKAWVKVNGNGKRKVLRGGASAFITSR
jgi:hypothetical protein